MDYYGFIKRDVFDEVDIARQSNQNTNDDEHYEAVDSQPDDNVCGGQDKAKPLQISPDNVLPNPGVSCDAEEYFMGNRERGVALIFNHEKFDLRVYPDRKHQPEPRIGTSVDRDALHGAFKSLGFEVSCFDDLRYFEISSELRRVAEQNHSDRDCIAVVVLSHGERNGMLDARDRDYNVCNLWEPFTARRCPTLAGKPKLFFIQACKGTECDPGVTVRGISTDGPDDDRGEQLTYPVPSYADILVSYSTFEGQYSYRNPKTGSWYIQTLCSQLKDHGRTKDLVSLLTDVNRIVAQSFRSENKENPKLHGMLQASCFTSSLTRRLCFGHNGQTDHQRSSPSVRFKRPRPDSGNVPYNSCVPEKSH